MMKNTKKNTGANPRISMNTEIMSGRIIQKIDEIGRKTYALKKKENVFYAEVEKKSHHTKYIGTDKLRKMAFDRFGQEWKKIEDGKNEVNWMIYRLYISVEGEEEKKQKNKKIKQTR